MESMDQIFRDHAKTVYKYLMTLTGDADLAEELTQETFYQAVKSSGRFDGSCKITTWLCAIAKNQLAAYRRKHREMENYEDQVLTAPSAEQQAVAQDSSLGILRHIHDLSEPYREVLYLRGFGGLSFAEIGEVFGKSENWARVTCYRGKEKLKKQMEDGQ